MRDFQRELFSSILRSLKFATTKKLTISESLELPKTEYKDAGNFLKRIKIYKTKLTIDDAKNIFLNENVYGILVKIGSDMYNIGFINKIHKPPQYDKTEEYDCYIYMIDETIKPKNNVYTKLVDSLKWISVDIDIKDALKSFSDEFNLHDTLSLDVLLEKFLKYSDIIVFDSIVADCIIYDTIIYPWYSIVINNVKLTYAHPNNSGSSWCFGSGNGDPLDIQRIANLDSAFTTNILPTNWKDIISGIKEYVRVN